MALTITKVGPNKFEVTHDEMRIVPTVNFKESPEGVTPKISDASKTGFTVQFEPKTINVEKFGLELSAEL